MTKVQKWKKLDVYIVILGSCVVLSTLMAFYQVNPIRGLRLVEEETRPRKNVLMIVIDDLRPQLGIYHDTNPKMQLFSGMYTPQIDQLASQSLLIKNAFAQYTVCAPSRASALTGRRPQTTRVYDLHEYWRKTGGNFTTIPQYFKQNGFLTKGVGKIFHHGSACGGDNDGISWTHPFFQPKCKHWRQRTSSWIAVSKPDRQTDPLIDDMVLKEAKKAMQELSAESEANNTHFFLAVGFYKPHLPWIFPEEFLDLYPLKKVDLAPNKYAPMNMPEIAASYYYELKRYSNIKAMRVTGKHNDTLPDYQSKLHRRAYYACVSYVDLLVGELMQELENLGLADNTVVSLWGDHGFLLGDYGTWCKHSMFELATRVPMLLRVPGMTDHGLVTDHLVELVDLFPTLVEVAGLPLLKQCPDDSRGTILCSEGESFAELLRNTDSPTWKQYVFSEQTRPVGNQLVLGQSIRSQRYRYTEWPSTSPKKINWNDLHGKELYDLQNDPLQQENVAGQRGYRFIEESLSSHLKAGWRKAQCCS